MAVLLNQSLALALVLWVIVGAVAVAMLEGAYWADHRLSTAPQGGHASLQTTPPRTPVFPLPFAPAVAPREFADVSLQFLFELGKTPNLTSAQTGKLVLPYQGQWISVQGIIDNVDPSALFRQVIVLVANSDMSTGRVLAYFRDQFDRVDALTKGAPIRFVGRIEHVTPTHLSLDPCEFAKGASIVA